VGGHIASAHSVGAGANDDSVMVGAAAVDPHAVASMARSTRNVLTRSTPSR
jgi:hypothetical protein